MRNNKKKNLELLKRAHDKIYSSEFLEASRKSARDFTRKRAMPFVFVVTFILNFLSKSLTTELRGFFRATELGRRVSKQAFSKARHKIKAEAFQELYDLSVEVIMEDPKDLEKYKGFNVFGIDGTEVCVEPTAELVEKFGQKESRDNCKAQVSILVDVFDRTVIDARIGRYDHGERVFALEHLEALGKYRSKKDLVILDRGYPSKEMIAYLESIGIKYLMRVRKKFNTQIDRTQKEDFYVTIGGSKVRVIKLALPSGEEETLITNLARNQFKKAEFMALYFLRWPVETAYDTVKNKLEIESFSGRTHQSVMQDFWSTMYLMNVVALAKAEADEAITGQDAAKVNKYGYQANESALISDLKDQLVLCLLERKPKKRAQILERIIAEATRAKSEIRPGRSFERKVKPKHSVKRKRKSVL